MADKIDMIYDEVKYLREQNDKVREDVSTIKTDVGKLKVKSSIWGGVSGAVPAGLALAWFYLKNKVGG